MIDGPSPVTTPQQPAPTGPPWGRLPWPNWMLWEINDHVDCSLLSCAPVAQFRELANKDADLCIERNLEHIAHAQAVRAWIPIRAFRTIVLAAVGREPQNIPHHPSPV